jgi:hypothetical protein
MKKSFLLLFVLLSVSAFSQTNYDTVKLKSDADYKAANKYALEAANYVFAVPFDANDMQRVKSIQFVIKWMEGTPDFSFAIDATVMEKIVKGNDDLLGYYMVGMTKYCLENEANAKDIALVKLNTTKMILAYCEKPENNLKLTSALKKLAVADKKGKLAEELE